MILRILILLHVIPSLSFAQSISCDSARTLPLGSLVTIRGIITSGSEFGTIRYIQDPTGGIALFSSTLNMVTRGDSIEVSGVTADYFNLLELSPVNNHSIISSSNTLPSAQIIDPVQLNEYSESELVQINNVSFASGGQVFQANTAYHFTSNSQSGQVYIRNSNPLVGTSIPAGICNVRGICTQFTNTYQLLPRDSNDIMFGGGLYFVNLPKENLISNSGFTVSWVTNTNCTSEFKYGLTSALELGVLSAGVGTSYHSVNITGASASQIYYGRVVAYLANDTIYSPIRTYITASNSSGNILAYFNKPIESSVAIPGNIATTIGTGIDDTIISYINRAKFSIDIALYNFDQNGISDIASALNNAFLSGRQVRIIVDGGNANLGMTQLNPIINRLTSPTSVGYGIMHNKFMIIDATSSDHNDPLVLTGSTNWTADQINNDANNCVLIQDKSIAIAYTMEFEEMWGSNGPQPDTLQSKFGPDKKDNTPHVFNVGNKVMEVYFSPSDNANDAILRAVSESDFELQAAVMVITRQDIANAIADRSIQGVDSYVLVNDTGSGGIAFSTMYSILGSNIMLDNQSGIMHHKFLIVDQAYPFADPMVLTGSHNWSNSAEQLNDENTVLMYDFLIANQFYQAFVKLNNVNGGSLNVQAAATNKNLIWVYPIPCSDFIHIKMFEEIISLSVFDVLGRPVGFSFAKYQKDGYQLSTKDLHAGIYFIRVHTKSYDTLIRIIKQ